MLKCLIGCSVLLLSFNSVAMTIELPVEPQMTCEIKELYGDVDSVTQGELSITYDRSVAVTGSSPTHYFKVESLENDYESEYTFGYKSRSVAYFYDERLQSDYFVELCGNYTELSDKVYYAATGDGGPFYCLVCR